jgi:hypothetical protein
MTEQKIYLEEWRELYDLAVSLKELKPWEWMWDGDVFGVEDPETGEVGYCCVMGRGGEHYALAFYRGSEGLLGYLKVRGGEVPFDSPDAQHCQDCLMLSFEDRVYLHPKDRALIKRLGLRFRGANAWPLFRDWTPGYFPWFLTPDQARLLLRLLPPALEMAERLRSNPRLLEEPEPGKWLVRSSRSGREGTVWGDEWRFPNPLPEPEAEGVPYLYDLEGLRHSITRRSGVWEIDYFYSPLPVREKGARPYYPRMMMAADRRSGLLIFFHLVGASSSWGKELIDAFLLHLEKIQVIPEKMLVRENGYELLKGVAAGLGIKLEKAKKLPALWEAREYFSEFFSSGPGLDG